MKLLSKQGIFAGKQLRVATWEVTTRLRMSMEEIWDVSKSWPAHELSMSLKIFLLTLGCHFPRSINYVFYYVQEISLWNKYSNTYVLIPERSLETLLIS